MGKKIGLNIALVVLFFISLLFFSSPGFLSASFAQTAPTMAVMQNMTPSITKVENGNWTGYGDSETSGSVSDVSSNFTMPALTCSGPGTNQNRETFFIVSIDGWNSNDFANAGVVASCTWVKDVGVNLTWHAEWYDSITDTYVLSTWRPNPGDNISASIVVISGNFTFSINDTTTGESIGGSASAAGAVLNHPSCLVDTIDGRDAIKFYSILFTNCIATINGSTKGIGALGSSSLVEYIYVPSSGSNIAPSKLTDKMNFCVKEKHSQCP